MARMVKLEELQAELVKIYDLAGNTCVLIEGMTWGGLALNRQAELKRGEALTVEGTEIVINPKAPADHWVSPSGSDTWCTVGQLKKLIAEVVRLSNELAAERGALTLTLDLVQDSFGNGMMRAAQIAEELAVGTGLQGKSIAEAVRAEVALCEPTKLVLHILGPDDVIDQADELTALRAANKHNVAFAKLMANDPSPNDPYCVAVAEPV